MFENQKGPWSLIVHGGAKEISPGEEDDNRRGILEALAEGRQILEQGGGAVDAVEAAIRRLEDLPIFNAGRGSALNEAHRYLPLSASWRKSADRRDAHP